MCNARHMCMYLYFSHLSNAMPSLLEIPSSLSRKINSSVLVYYCFLTNVIKMERKGYLDIENSTFISGVKCSPSQRYPA